MFSASFIAELQTALATTLDRTVASELAELVQALTKRRLLNLAQIPEEVFTLHQLGVIETLAGGTWLSAKAAYSLVFPTDELTHGKVIAVGRQLASTYHVQRFKGPTRYYWIEAKP